MPQVVISDRGTVFISKFMKDLNDLLQIKANTSTTWHPQTDGQTEQVNQEVEKYLRIFVNHLQDDWVEWLSLAAFAHNNYTHSATGKSPFEINYGYNANVLPGTFPHSCLDHICLTDEKDTCRSQAITQESHQPNESPI